MIRTGIYILIFSFGFAGIICGQSSVRKELYQAFLHNDVDKWKLASLNYEKKADLNKTADLLQLIHCYYGWVSVSIHEKDYKTAKNNIQKAEKWIDRILEKEPRNAEALNYKGVFTGYTIMLNKLKAASLGKQSVGLIKKAHTIAPNNVQILFDLGNVYYYSPKIFGGNKSEALEYFQKAISIIEKQKNTECNWMYVQMLMLEARCNELLGNIEAAKAGYEKTLKAEPDFKIVRCKFYPELQKK